MSCFLTCSFSRLSYSFYKIIHTNQQKCRVWSPYWFMVLWYSTTFQWHPPQHPTLDPLGDKRDVDSQEGVEGFGPARELLQWEKSPKSLYHAWRFQRCFPLFVNSNPIWRGYVSNGWLNHQLIIVSCYGQRIWAICRASFLHLLDTVTGLKNKQCVIQFDELVLWFYVFSTHFRGIFNGKSRSLRGLVLQEVREVEIV